MDIIKGSRSPLDKIITGHTFKIESSITGLDIDFACFGLDIQQKLSNDAYMTFFNQPKTPCGAVEYSDSSFACQLDKLPVSIDRLVFTAAGEGAMKQIQSGYLRFMVSDKEAARFSFSGVDFQDEKAIMLAELYRKDGSWRFSAIGQGFNGGLDALVKHFGGEVEETKPKISLEKKISDKAPKLIDLAKKATISLEKHKLTATTARIGLILDASGSMRNQYSKGKVQGVIDRLVPLAVHFDDDETLDAWSFSTDTLALPGATLENYADYINTAEHGWKQWRMMSSNNEPLIIKQVIDYYKDTALPVFIIFISDGGVSRNTEIKKLLTDAASLPIFWQFIGLGGSNYGVLQKLDTLPNRIVDNCGFFSLDDLESVTEQELYDRLLSEFPIWLKDAKIKGIIQ